MSDRGGEFFARFDPFEARENIGKDWFGKRRKNHAQGHNIPSLQTQMKSPLSGAKKSLPGPAIWAGIVLSILLPAGNQSHCH
jgi:hypothetical protein